MSKYLTPFIVLATRNPNKVRELQAQFADFPIPLVGLENYPDAPDPEETGDSFEENAGIKARSVALHTRQWSLADDSGICIDALDGAPGIFSARWAGVASGQSEWIAKTLDLLQDVPDERRTAQYVCSLALCRPDGVVVATESARWQGRIAREPRGGFGFGYDPIFLPDDHLRTAAEMSEKEKDDESHRYRAANLMYVRLREHLYRKD